MLTDSELVSVILTHPRDSHQQIADRLGLPVRLVQYKLTRPGFREKLAYSRKSYIEDAAAYAESGMQSGLQVLSEEMLREENHAETKIRAATAFVKFGLELNKQTVVIPRLMQLEAFIAQQQAQQNGVTFEVDSDLDECSLDSFDLEAESPVPASTGEDSTHRMPHSGRSTGGEGDSRSAADGPADSNVGDSVTLAPAIQKRLSEIVAKFKGN